VTGRGFTLVECLIGLALSLVVVTAGLGSYITIQRAFLRLEARESSGQSALAAVDRMRIDLLHAGAGLVEEIRLGLLEPVAADAGELRTVTLDRPLTLAAGAAAGDTRLFLASAAGLSAGRRIALRAGPAGEVKTVVRVDGASIVLDGPLAGSYPAAAAAVSLLETVAYFVDGAAGVLRRRANASPAQPLAESVAAAAWSYDRDTGLAVVRVELSVEGAHDHGATVFVKNAALARTT
jgi:prepilin-type N-terminal cleavage/methylation domain-containing protein